ncbi:MAG TPA: ABC transporter substrate-binding protein [Thermomicrobiales bacterium]|nr:ABC transporter substrate-binding protein [Thermomicrobiales bacterium]
MTHQDDGRFLDLVLGARTGALTRRQVLQRGLALGLSTPVIMGLLAACGGEEDAPTATTVAPAEATPTRVQVGVATATPAVDATATSPAASRNESDNKIFTMAFTGGVPDVDPQSAYDNQASSMFLATYEMLLRLKGESTFEYEPMLAYEWESNDELTEFTFRIREGITFHDGTACDAQAIVDSLTRFHEMGRGPVDVIVRFVPDPGQMEAVDATTVKFTLTKPEPLFLAAMASEYGPLIVSPAAMEANKTDADPYAHEWFAQNMVGTGPYIATEIEAQERFVMDRFEGYQHGPHHFFDRVIARVVPEDVTRRQLIETGDVDGLAVLPTDDLIQLRSNPQVQVVEYETTQCSWINLNYVRLTRDAREGLCWAFPYDAVIDQVLQGFAKKQGPIADTVVGFDPSVPLFDTDLEKAAELLEAGGVNPGDELEYLFADGDAPQESWAQLLQANLAEIGHNLVLQKVDRSHWVDLAYGDTPPEERPHMMSSGWWPDYNDSYNQLYPTFHPDSAGSAGSNLMFYGNQEFGDLLDQARDAETEDELIELTGRMLQIMMWDDPAAVFFAQRTRAQVLRSDIRGFKPNGIYIASWNFHEMWREAT